MLGILQYLQGFLNENDAQMQKLNRHFVKVHMSQGHMRCMKYFHWLYWNLIWPNQSKWKHQKVRQTAFSSPAVQTDKDQCEKYICPNTVIMFGRWLSLSLLRHTSNASRNYWLNDICQDLLGCWLYWKEIKKRYPCSP